MTTPPVESELVTATAAKVRGEPVSGGDPGVVDRRDTVGIVGAGPAGLAMARALAERGIPYAQFERHHRIGGIWDIERADGPMYDSAHFISSRDTSAFLRHPMPSTYPDYPGHRQVLAYLDSFARRYALTADISFGVAVHRVEQDADGHWLVTTAPVGNPGTTTTYRFRALVCASGAQWHPRLPGILDDFAGEVMPAQRFRNPTEFAGRRTLVIGAGNSGCDIAADIGRVSPGCVLSARRGYWVVPKHIAGVPTDIADGAFARLPRRVRRAFAELALRLSIGDVRRFGLQKPDHHLLDSHPIIGTQIIDALAHGNVIAKPDLARIDGTSVEFVDASRAQFDTIIAATGYEPRVPYAEAYFGGIGDDELYLGTFSRRFRGLFLLGLGESNSAGFFLFDTAAAMIASHLLDEDRAPAAAARFRHRIATERPDLTGGLRFTDSPRHHGYVDSEAFVAAADKIIAAQGWSHPSRPPETPGSAATGSGKPARQEYAGRVAVVTGAGSGMGRALALELARRGAALSLCDRDPAGLAETARLALAIGAQTHHTVVNVAERDEVRAFAADVVAEHGAVNLVFNNAGIAHHGPVEQTDLAVYDRLMDVDFWGVVSGTKAFLPHLIAARDAHIVNTSSSFGLIAAGGQSAYSAAKFAVRGFTESLRIEMLANHPHVKVSCVFPGGIQTAIARNATVAAGIDQARAAALFDEQLAPTTAEDAARIILRGVRQGRARILIGMDAWLPDIFARLTGSVYHRLYAGIDRKTTEEIRGNAVLDSGTLEQ